VQGFLKNERENALLAVIEHTRKNVRYKHVYVALEEMIKLINHFVKTRTNCLSDIFSISA